MTQNSTPTTPDSTHEAFVAWPPAILEDAVEEILEKHGYNDRQSTGQYGRLTGPMVRQLARLARQTPTPERLVKTSPPVTGKPYASTGLTSLQPQIEMANAIYGEAHWRWWIEPSADTDGTYLVTLLIGNHLHDIVEITGEGEMRASGPDTEVLVSHTLLGSNPNGSNPANKMKGALTNAGKRLLATVGCCGDVYRFDGDGDPDDPAAAGAPARRTGGGSGSPSDKQLDYLVRLLRTDAGQDLVRMRGLLGRMATVADVAAPELVHGGEFEKTARQLAKAHLAKGQVGEIIEGLKERAQNGGRPTSPPANAPSAGGAPTTNGASAPSTPASAPPTNGAGTVKPDPAQVQRAAPQPQQPPRPQYPSGMDPAEDDEPRNGFDHLPADYPG